MFEFITLKTVLVIIHLLGVILGMGAAFMTDIMFMNSTKNKILDDKELSFIALGSRTVWIGLFLVIISGIALVAQSPDVYLNSSKFLTKMTVVLVLTLNGIVFHFKHLPFLRTQANQDLLTSESFKHKSKGLFVSGAISSVSWTIAVILGVLRGIPYSYTTLVSAYLLILLFAIATSFLVRKMFLSK